jgi:hypothetical protein
VTRLCVVVLLCLSVGCFDDRIHLERGPLGPATYTVSLDVDGDPALATERLDAVLRVTRKPGGATLDLSVADEDPIRAELRRLANGRLELEAVQGVSPGVAGEADLASLVGQLDPPLTGAPVRIGQRWSRARHISTETLDASLRTNLKLVRFARENGVDVAELAGTVSGRLSTAAPTGTFEGTVRGQTRISWALGTGRLASSDTRLVWTVSGAGDVILRTTVGPN